MSHTTRLRLVTFTGRVNVCPTVAHRHLSVPARWVLQLSSSGTKCEYVDVCATNRCPAPVLTVQCHSTNVPVYRPSTSGRNGNWTVNRQATMLQALVVAPMVGHTLPTNRLGASPLGYSRNTNCRMVSADDTMASTVVQPPTDFYSWLPKQKIS